MTIEVVISGGQYGADLAGLQAALDAGIPTGGWAPKDYRTERGSNYNLRDIFNLKEHRSSAYPPRTELNVKESDATVIFSERMSSGTNLTIDLCVKHNKPYVLINPFKDDPRKLVTFINGTNPSVVNIAGNRESVSPGIERCTIEFLKKSNIFSKST